MMCTRAVKTIVKSHLSKSECAPNNDIHRCFGVLLNGERNLLRIQVLFLGEKLKRPRVKTFTFIQTLFGYFMTMSLRLKLTPNIGMCAVNFCFRN